MELYKYHPQGGVRTLMEHPLVQAARQCRSKGSVVTMSLAICDGRVHLPNGRLSHTLFRRDGELCAELVFTGDGVPHLLEVYRQDRVPLRGYQTVAPTVLMTLNNSPAHLSFWLQRFVDGERCSARFCGRYDDPHHASLISGVYDFALG